MSNVYYCIIARDSDMVVFEYLINKELKQNQLKDTIVEMIGQKEEQKKEMIEYMFSPEYMQDLQSKAAIAEKDDENNSGDEESQQQKPIKFPWMEPLPTITGGAELHLQL